MAWDILDNWNLQTGSIFDSSITYIFRRPWFLCFHLWMVSEDPGEDLRSLVSQTAGWRHTIYKVVRFFLRVYWAWDRMSESTLPQGRWKERGAGPKQAGLRAALMAQQPGALLWMGIYSKGRKFACYLWVAFGNWPHMWIYWAINRGTCEHDPVWVQMKMLFQNRHLGVVLGVVRWSVPSDMTFKETTCSSW
jgi:hypothetical protein